MQALLLYKIPIKTGDNYIIPKNVYMEAEINCKFCHLK